MHLPAFLTMHGYGAYVWTAYGITVCVFVGNFIFSWREKHRIQKLLRHDCHSSHA